MIVKSNIFEALQWWRQGPWYEQGKMTDVLLLWNEENCKHIYFISGHYYVVCLWLFSPWWSQHLLT